MGTIQRQVRRKPSQKRQKENRKKKERLKEVRQGSSVMALVQGAHTNPVFSPKRHAVSSYIGQRKEAQKRRNIKAMGGRA